MRILITDHEKADFLVSKPLDYLVAVVSIYANPKSRMAAFGTPTEPCEGFDKFQGAKLALCFDDAEVEGQDVYPPQKEDISLLVEWSKGIEFDEDAFSRAHGSQPPAEMTDGTILFHCQAGISRSTAAALVFLASKLPKGFEALAVSHIVMRRKVAWFNESVVFFGDELLGRDGQLLETVQAWKRAERARGLFAE